MFFMTFFVRVETSMTQRRCSCAVCWFYYEPHVVGKCDISKSWARMYSICTCKTL